MRSEVLARLRCCLSQSIAVGRVHYESFGAEILTGGGSSGIPEARAPSLRIPVAFVFAAFFLFLLIFLLFVLVFLFCASGNEAVDGHQAISGFGKPSGKGFAHGQWYAQQGDASAGGMPCQIDESDLSKGADSSTLPRGSPVHTGGSAQAVTGSSIHRH